MLKDSVDDEDIGTEEFGAEDVPNGLPGVLEILATEELVAGPEDEPGVLDGITAPADVDTNTVTV